MSERINFPETPKSFTNDAGRKNFVVNNDGESSLVPRRSRRADVPATNAAADEATRVRNIDHEIALAMNKKVDDEAQIAALEAWGGNDQLIAVDNATGERVDYEGYKQWRADHEPSETDFNNLDDAGNLKSGLEAQDLTQLNFMQLVGEARKYEQLGDVAGKDDVLNVVQDQLAERAVAEDWPEEELFFQLDRFNSLVGAEAAAKAVQSEETPAEQFVADTEPSDNQPEPTIEAAPDDEDDDEADEIPDVKTFTPDDSVYNTLSARPVVDPAEAIIDGPVMDADDVESSVATLRDRTVVAPEADDTTSTEADGADDIEQHVAVEQGSRWDRFKKSPVDFLGQQLVVLSHRLKRTNEVVDVSDAERKNRRKKLLILGAGAVALTAVVLDRTGVLKDWHDGIFGGGAPAPTTAPGPGLEAVSGDIPSRSPQLDMPFNDPTEASAGHGSWGGSEALSTTEARTASVGEGWYGQLSDMGIPEHEQAALLPKILNSPDPELRSWVYEMSDGNPGIAHPGAFSENVLKSIQNLR